MSNVVCSENGTTDFTDSTDIFWLFSSAAGFCLSVRFAPSVVLFIFFGPPGLSNAQMHGKLFLKFFRRTTDGTQRPSRSQSSADFQVCRIAGF
ncbi:MAG: hypothetical protein DME76_19890 [Verrucomicrobia bacterium]|nr:MAG: hypothetical protein DME76_19890 [Verrucomicrobiota bacterium]